MKALIVCESLFGNTELLAEGVAKGLRHGGVEAEVVEVGHADGKPLDLDALDLLIVAAPTHALTLSSPESRADAVARGADPRREEFGVREWLSAVIDPVPADAKHPPVAVFDTRVEKSRHWPGSAAHRAARWLRRDGFKVVDRRSFYVAGISGPLTPGEIGSAERWGATLAEVVTGR